MKFSTKVKCALFNGSAYFSCFEITFLGKLEPKKDKIGVKTKLVPTLIQIYRIQC